MPFGVLNVLMLAGLAGVAIPLLIHLLNRRRYDVVDWGAMQFLQISETTRRRILIEELLLMLLRMGLIAILVLALASPFLDSAALARLAGGGRNRDVVLVFDGSYSMGYRDNGRSAHDAAKEWAAAFVNDLAAGDSVAVLQAKQQVVPVARHADAPTWTASATASPTCPRRPAAATGPPRSRRRTRSSPTSSRARARHHPPQRRPAPTAGPTTTACSAGSCSPARLRDESGHGRGRTSGSSTWPRTAPPTPPNWSLAPLRASRAVASVGQQVTFRTALEIRGQERVRPAARACASRWTASPRRPT